MLDYVMLHDSIVSVGVYADVRLMGETAYLHRSWHK